MASINELKEIFKAYEGLPNHAICLRGISGVGKSEFVKYFYESLGYRVETLFVGQLSDVGDLIGLPKISTDENGNSITEFCPPKWFPINKDEKVILFLDEVNRAQSEMESALMDLLLNRKIQGRSLPTSCRIVSAINPSSDSSYNVREMDVAFLDRFNLYEFKPTVDDWITWAVDSQIDSSVVNFISSNKDYLDKPSEASNEPDKVTPSRRSWAKVSQVLKHCDNIKSNLILLKNMLDGIVGTSAASKFIAFLKTEDNVTAGYILTKLHTDKNLITKLKTKIDIQTSIYMNTQMEIWLREAIDEKSLHTNMKKEDFGTILKNLETYLDEVLSPEAMSEFVIRIRDNQTKYKWPNIICQFRPSIMDKMLDIMDI